MEIQVNCTKALDSTKDKLYRLNYYYYFTKSHYVNVQTYTFKEPKSRMQRKEYTHIY